MNYLYFGPMVLPKRFISNLINFSLIVMFLQILIGSIVSPSGQLKARNFLKIQIWIFT